MVQDADRRSSSRVRFLWPVWFGYESLGQLNRGQAVDLGASGISFTVASDCCPTVGEHILTRFSYPVEDLDVFEMDSFQDWCEVVRVEPFGYGSRKVVVRLPHEVGCFGVDRDAEVLEVSGAV